MTAYAASSEQERELVAAWLQSAAELAKMTETHKDLMRRVAALMADGGHDALTVDGRAVAGLRAQRRWNADKADTVLSSLYGADWMTQRPQLTKVTVAPDREAIAAVLPPQLYAACQAEGEPQLIIKGGA